MDKSDIGYRGKRWKNGKMEKLMEFVQIVFCYRLNVIQCKLMNNYYYAKNDLKMRCVCVKNWIFYLYWKSFSQILH